MKKLIFLSIAGLFGLTAVNAQSKITVPGILKDGESEVEIRPDGTQIFRAKCDPYFNNVCYEIESKGPIIAPRANLTLTLFSANNIAYKVVDIDNFQYMDYKEDSRGGSTTAIYFKPSESETSNN